MFNGINLFLITFARYHFNIDPQILTDLVISIAAAAAAIFLSVIILLFRSIKSLNTEVFTSLTQGGNKYDHFWYRLYYFS
ncbi:NADH-quinone oxidoreductase subunit NuoK, partial [Aliarcobacter butzleri]|uniref:NADH-quinone oxidoreductase subunit NuoK n=1 Tax=Aliarcobacter butzleri TaxID=28197 RepID=UPI003AE3A2DF